MKNNEHTRQQTIQTAIDNLKEASGLRANWRAGKIAELDGELEIQIQGKPVRFNLELKTEIRNHHLPRILEQATRWKNFMVLANRIIPGIKEELRDNHIAYLEANGNIYIDKKPVYIWMDQNRKLTLPREKTNRAFTKAGLKVVFLFLTNPTYINEPYRTIAETTGTALGNINNVIKGLLAYGYLLKMNEDKLILNDWKRLLDKWISTYEEKLKPKLHLGNYRALEPKDWEQDVYLNPVDTVWGGEPAGNILTKHLRPGTITLYTTVTAKEIMKKHRLVPDTNGDVSLFEKFWRHEIYDGITAPPILVYADLMNTNNKRCRETAQVIYERYIEPGFK